MARDGASCCVGDVTRKFAGVTSNMEAAFRDFVLAVMRVHPVAAADTDNVSDVEANGGALATCAKQHPSTLPRFVKDHMDELLSVRSVLVGRLASRQLRAPQTVKALTKTYHRVNDALGFTRLYRERERTARRMFAAFVQGITRFSTEQPFDIRLLLEALIYDAVYFHTVGCRDEKRMKELWRLRRRFCPEHYVAIYLEYADEDIPCVLKLALDYHTWTYTRTHRAGTYDDEVAVREIEDAGTMRQGVQTFSSPPARFPACGP